MHFPVLLAQFFTPDQVYDLFSSDTSDLRAARLLWKLLQFKYEYTKGEYGCIEEVKKLIKLMERRSQVGK